MSGFVCRGCKNHFLQDRLCVTCGAEKLYDATVESQAAEIERQRAEIERLRAALEYMVNVCPAIDPDGDRAHEQARKALEGKP